MRYVIAVGGNALTDPGTLKNLSRAVVGLRRRGSEIVITHGNGPQVGELASIESKSLAVLTAQTQAEIGLELENAMAGTALKVATVLTRVFVDPADREFKGPSKPIGPFLGKDAASRLSRKGFAVRKLFHGYRRVVPSPEPRRIMEAGLIRQLLKDGYVVIAAGGGGIAVVPRKGRLSYADAVIDKDRASSLLAAAIGADRLFILTNVDGAFKGYGGRKPELIRRATVREMRRLISSGEFEKGSMLPKVEACIKFITKTGRPAAIGNLRNAAEVLVLRKATVIVP